MRKVFNDVGICLPNRHFMADNSKKLEEIIKLVESGVYFTINRPRQYGKTTSVFNLFRILNEQEEYVAFRMSFEGIGDNLFEDEESFCSMFLDKLRANLKRQKKKHLEQLIPKLSDFQSFDDLSNIITLLSSENKKIVVLIDEIDKASNNQLFLSFLGMLRTKYLDTLAGDDHTFHSAILAGVHDIKSLKLKIAPDSKNKFNSPWNIAIDFKVEMSFNPSEIEVMLKGYQQERGVEMDTTAIADEIYYYTSGYPYLVSKLSKFVDEDVLPDQVEKVWNSEVTYAAFKLITYGGYSTTLFDSLTKYLENYEDLFRMVFDITINGASYSFNINAPVINIANTYGIIRDDNGFCRIHNRIFEQRLYGYFLAKQATEKGIIEPAEDPGFFLNGHLNLELILSKFQEFMQENYSHRDTQFLEREGRLIFLSFLKPILNGKGFDFKEPVVGDERRMDIVITHANKRYVVELKRWKGEVYHQEGLQRLGEYLDTYHLQKGFLLIFDFRKSKVYKEEHIQVGSKEIFAVWV
ncbi:MAG: AAA family ATPase [Bacteroidota bacterium]